MRVSVHLALPSVCKCYGGCREASYQKNLGRPPLCERERGREKYSNQEKISERTANEDMNQWMLHVPGLRTRWQRNNADFSGRPDKWFEAPRLQCPQPKNQDTDTRAPQNT
ncbi:hypothetical protein J4Q44_G00260720 [Coregonus suidteri]|uniref:Uncharacterized protein n=1 Tax=Coregonus suidteri TaxID=861788 RepID=A0AAN8QMT0_9TELE